MTKKPPSKPDLGTRDRLFAAAAAEFAARGFAGANVDRIAQAARVNKAMLYYHFKSKAGLYGEILRDMFGAVAGRLAEATPADADPRTRVRIMVETIAHAAEARPHFPPIWLREIAEGGAHIDPDTIAIVTRILEHTFVSVREGVRTGQFTPANPFLVQLGIVGPILMFFAAASLRRTAPAPLSKAMALTTDDVIEHVQRVTLLTLEGRPS
jgi:TetR/AcrR family transcriptional regulator